MKKLICSLLALSITVGGAAIASDLSENNISYLKAEEEYAYGMTYVITDKATGEVIPISIGPLDGYSYAYMPGVMLGYPDGTFGQYNKLTRAEMAAVFCRMFSIAPGDWCCGNIMTVRRP